MSEVEGVEILSGLAFSVATSVDSLIFIFQVK
jgi:hypothetical protein